MNKDKLIDALGKIDDDMIQEVEALRRRSKKTVWIRWTAMVASFIIIVSIGWYIRENIPPFYQDYSEPTATLDFSDSLFEGINGLYVNSCLYMPDTELSKIATTENIGDFVGYVSFDNLTATALCAFNYIPEDGETNKIIIPHRGICYVYTFLSYEPDGTTAWPVNLLVDANYIEIQKSDNLSDERIVCLTISDEAGVADMLTILSELGEKHDRVEIHQRYYERFKEHFKDGAIWLNEYGGISHINPNVGMRLTDLICENERMIVVVMENHAKLYFTYLPASGVILCYDIGFFLTDEQVAQINQMIGLE